MNDPMPTAESYRLATQSTVDNIDARPPRAIDNWAMGSKAGFFMLLAGWLASSGCSDARGTAGDGGGGLAGGAGGAGTGGSGGATAIDAGGTDAPTATACEGVDAGAIVSPAYADMDITASGFAEHEGRSVFLVTRSNSSGVIGARSVTVTGGGFAFRFPKGYKRSADQDLLWLIDADGDGRCNTDVGDHTGYLRVNAANPAGSDALEVAITDNHVRTTSGGVDICNPAAPFGDMMDFNITGMGFDAHDGQRVHLLTRTVYNGAIFGSGDAVVTGGGFAFHFPKGYQRFTYQEIFLFVDVDGDGACAPGTDHTAYEATNAFNPVQIMPIDEQVMDNHTSKSARNADVCVIMNGCQIAP
jgi:hypothetical protein